ncbi:hypothetical protein AAMO2058_001265700 [Amorphochlora amoebiformis]
MGALSSSISPDMSQTCGTRGQPSSGDTQRSLLRARFYASVLSTLESKVPKNFDLIPLGDKGQEKTRRELPSPVVTGRDELAVGCVKFFDCTLIFTTEKIVELTLSSVTRRLNLREITKIELSIPKSDQKSPDARLTYECSGIIGELWLGGVPHEKGGYILELVKKLVEIQKNLLSLNPYHIDLLSALIQNKGMYKVTYPGFIRVRAYPSPESKVLGVLRPGECVVCIEQEGDWVRHEKGWSILRPVSLTENVEGKRYAIANSHISDYMHRIRPQKIWRQILNQVSFDQKAKKDHRRLSTLGSIRSVTSSSSRGVSAVVNLPSPITNQVDLDITENSS